MVSIFAPSTLACKGGIFRNRALVGETTIQFEEKTVVIHHEAILEIAKFEAINAVLDGRKLREPRSPRIICFRRAGYLWLWRKV